MSTAGPVPTAGPDSGVPDAADSLPTPRHRALGRGRTLPAASILASLGLHAALLTLGAIVVYQAALSERRTTSEAVMNFDAPGQGESVPRPPVASAQSAAAAEIVPVPSSEHQPLTKPETRALGLAAPAPNPSLTLPAPGSTPGELEGLFAPSDDAGLAEGLSSAQSVSFAGLGASSARSVVYAVDCSGPMVTSLPIVLAEVRRSVSRLSPTQKFGVILCRRSADKPEVESFAPVLVRATPSARQRLSEWLASAEPSGRSSPLAGLEAALKLAPDAVFLLSRSIDRSGGAVWDLGLPATMARLDQLNPRQPGGRRAVTIQTIQFLDEDPTGTLQAIGTQHGPGKAGYRVITRTEDLSTR